MVRSRLKVKELALPVRGSGLIERRDAARALVRGSVHDPRPLQGGGERRCVRDGRTPDCRDGPVMYDRCRVEA
jgi:hypothetical protein